MIKYLMILAALMMMAGCDNGDPKSPVDNQPVKDDTAVTDDEPAETDTTTENTVVADDAEPDGKPDLDVPATCGNGVIDSGEICDGGSVYCGDLDEKWAFGTAYCNDTCSGYNTYECQEPYADDDETADDEIEDDPVLPDSDEQIDEDLVDIQPDPDMVDEDLVDIDTYDDWMPDTTDVQPDLDMVDEDTVDTDMIPDDDVVVPSGLVCTTQWFCYNATQSLYPCPAEGADFYGQDYQYSLQGKCIPRSYTISGEADNDIVTDNNTGLIWQRRVNTSRYTWAGAVAYCDNLIYGGQSDWRLPTRKELNTLPRYGHYNPSIDSIRFPGTEKSYYWSSSSRASLTDHAWIVSFYNSVVIWDEKTVTYPARCVRGDALPDSTSFTEETIAGEVIVTDTLTELQWTKEYASSVSWKNALSYCENLNYAGYTDWRLPNIEELKSLIDDTIYNPASAFPGMLSVSFWSSSSRVYEEWPGLAYPAFVVHFDNGVLGNSDKANSYPARCVR